MILTIVCCYRSCIISFSLGLGHVKIWVGLAESSLGLAEMSFGIILGFVKIMSPLIWAIEWCFELASTVF